MVDSGPKYNIYSCSHPETIAAVALDVTAHLITMSNVCQSGVEDSCVEIANTITSSSTLLT